MTGSDKFLPPLESIHNLLRYYPIQADLASIKVDTTSGVRSRVMVQLAATDLTTIAAGLLEWHRTLADSAAVAARTSDGVTVHLGVCGINDEDGSDVDVWGCAPYDPKLIGADLQPGERVSLPFEELAVWAIGVGRVSR